MPQKGKTKNAPNDKRHENNSGLAPPVGKRPVTRQRSHGQLNGHSNGKPATAAAVVSPPPLPSTGLNPGYKWPRTADANAESAHPATARDHALQAADSARDRTPSDASVEEAGPFGDMADHVLEHSAQHGADGIACKSSTPHATTTLPAVSTILAYYPLSDAISILILLLSLPPTLVLVIQTLFASLTFVPPTAGISLSTLPNIKDMFNSSNLGYPAMATILFVDLVFWVFWLPVWKPMQAVFLDLSQAVIAVSLSGAAASTGGPTYSIATCTLIVCVVHVLRYRAIHLTALDYLRSVLHNWSGDTVDSFFAPSFYSSTPTERGMAFTAIRAMLGIHIVSQGVTTCIRRTLANAKANERDPNLPIITKTDTEATAGAEHPLRLTSVPGDSPQPAHSSASSDGRPPGPPPARLDVKHRDLNSKKKRKQANQVRSQQPLWAAIASTKVTFVKEMEQRDAADDAREATAMDNDTTTPFVANTNTTTNRIWIQDVGDTEVYFAVELSQEPSRDEAENMENLQVTTAGIDKSKPFFVRINGAAWSSTRISPSEEDPKRTGEFYHGQIFGLAPLSPYRCELVSVARQHVLCSVGLITQPPPTAEQAAAAPAPPQHSALRPSSPITTLKLSIQSAEAKLKEIQNRTKKTKKDQRSTHADIKREINLLKGKLESSGGADDRQERRLLQINQHKNQAEEATAELKQQIENLGEIPQDELDASELQKQTWQSALDAKQAAERDLEEAKAEQDRELNALKTDIVSSESRREKLNSRKVQRVQELEKLTAKQQADMTAKEKRDFDRAQILQDRENRTNELQFHIAQMDQEAVVLHQKAHEAHQQASSLSTWASQPAPSYPGYPGYSSPPTPEGILPNSNGQISPQANGFPAGAFNPPQFGSPFSTQATVSNPAPTGGPRGRSSSMFSQYSGFTDNADEYAPAAPEPRPWPLHSSSSGGGGGGSAPGPDRKTSDGDSASASGSGSASGGTSLVNGSTNGSNSPRPEAKPFVPKSVGTIGPPSKKPSPRSPPAANIGAAGSGR